MSEHDLNEQPVNEITHGGHAPAGAQYAESERPARLKANTRHGRVRTEPGRRRHDYSVVA